LNAIYTLSILYTAGHFLLSPRVAVKGWGKWTRGKKWENVTGKRKNEARTRENAKLKSELQKGK
jgi:hypothetical protein